MKALVVIASHGTRNDAYLAQLIEEYHSMSFDVDVIVLSNLQKEVAPRVEVVVVDLSSTDPWTLPFLHKQIFAERIEEYDLFIYSEDDTLIREDNLHAFLDATAVLNDDEIAGLLRFERDAEGGFNYPEIHGHFHWDPASVRVRGEHTFAFFTNEHAACYVLTREHLRRAIRSGGFLVSAHSGKYDLLCTAATDPYTQCGMKKLVCLSAIRRSLVHHLPNKYCGTRFGVDEIEFTRQLGVLLNKPQADPSFKGLVSTETALTDASFSKDYYEPLREDIVREIPQGVRTVLSVGCGSGATESWLARSGVRVAAIPLDAVIGAGAEANGVELIQGDFSQAATKLKGRQFDCLLILNVLHLVPNPSEILEMFRDSLSPGATAIVSVPNVNGFSEFCRGARKRKITGRPRGYERSGVHVTSASILRRWIKRGGLRRQKTEYVLSERARTLGRVALGQADGILASEFIVVAKRV